MALLPFGSPPPSGGGAPTNASYVTLTNNGTLTSERVLTAGAGITVTDAGANNTVTISTVAAAPSILRTFLLMGA